MMVRWSGECQVNVRWMSGECQVNVKSQSELDLDFLRNLHICISIINNIILHACFLKLWTILWAFGMCYKLSESPLCQVPLVLMLLSKIKMFIKSLHLAYGTPKNCMCFSVAYFLNVTKRVGIRQVMFFKIKIPSFYFSKHCTSTKSGSGWKI